MISGKGFHGGGGDRVNRFVHSLGKLLREVADQERNIAVALAKWREPGWGKIQPEEKGRGGFFFRRPRLPNAGCGSKQTSLGAPRPRTAPPVRIPPLPHAPPPGLP